MTDLPFLTADLPGTGGVLKAEPGDFVVEEIPAYAPCGEGEHLFLWIEKEDVPADALVRHLSQALGVPRKEIGVAGLKDRRAVTRQSISVPARVEERVAGANTDAIRVLSATRHTNKLKTGHLKGNRFSVLLRVGAAVQTASSSNEPDGPHNGPYERAEEIVSRLREFGVPNYYGEQRFGIGGETADLGFALLRGEKTAKDIPFAKRKFLLRLSLSAAQSDLFNLALADRMRRGELRTVLAGDVMRKVASGGLFVAEDVPTEQARLDAGETQVTGPLFGPKMPQPRGEPTAREAALLAAADLPSDAFRRYPKLTTGTRRPYLIAIPDLAAAPESDGLRVTFTLPPGAYATVVMREIMK
jgi:tRNA pseudouridine13 synthase